MREGPTGSSIKANLLRGGGAKHEASDDYEVARLPKGGEVRTNTLQTSKTARLVAVAVLGVLFTMVRLGMTPAGASVQKHSTLAPTCDGLTATIVGTSGNDTLVGTPGNDVIVAKRGADVVDGHGGNDVICGNGGSDDISGGNGDDTELGGGGNDDLQGDDGDDTLEGGSGSDDLQGDDGNDDLQGDDGDDSLDGGSGDDTEDGGDGDDSTVCNSYAGDDDDCQGDENQQ
jgi:Ca2+-binding RTX toxin-like protein